MSDLSDQFISNTFFSLLHLSIDDGTDNEGLRVGPLVTIVQDGSGNHSALALGRAGYGATISGNLSVLGTDNRILASNLTMIASDTIALSATDTLILSGGINRMTATNNIITGKVNINGTTTIGGDILNLNSGTVNVTGTANLNGTNNFNGSNNFGGSSTSLNSTTVNIGGPATTDINLTSSKTLDMVVKDINIGGSTTTNFDVVAADINIGRVNAAGTNTIEIGNDGTNTCGIIADTLNLGNANSNNCYVEANTVSIGTTSSDNVNLVASNIILDAGTTNGHQVSLRGDNINIGTVGTDLVVIGHDTDLDQLALKSPNIDIGLTSTGTIEIGNNSNTSSTILGAKVNLGSASTPEINILGDSIEIGDSTNTRDFTLRGDLIDIGGFNDTNSVQIFGSDIDVGSSVGTAPTSALNLFGKAIQVGSNTAGHTTDVRTPTFSAKAAVVNSLRINQVVYPGSGAAVNDILLVDDNGNVSFSKSETLESSTTNVAIKTVYYNGTPDQPRKTLTMPGGAANKNKWVVIDLPGSPNAEKVKGGIFYIQLQNGSPGLVDFRWRLYGSPSTPINESTPRPEYPIFLTNNNDRYGVQFQMPIWGSSASFQMKVLDDDPDDHFDTNRVFDLYAIAYQY